MNQESIAQLYDFYQDFLFNNCLPFWLKHSLDNQFGGYLTCLDRKGQVYNTDKSIWFQGRGTWLYTSLYNSFEHRQEWLEAAKTGYQFLRDHGFDTDGRMFFEVTQDGRSLRKRRYVFSEMFAIMACVEYFIASGDEEARDKALTTYNLLLDIYRNPSKILPKVNPKTRATKSHSLYMMLLCTTQILREIEKDKNDSLAEELVVVLFRDFVKPDEKALFETVGLNGERLDNPQGRCINPGHAIESAWFLMHEGLYRNDQKLLKGALDILDWSFEIGWDKEHGGILYFVDIEGKPPEQLEWDMKLWWVHTEALYALLLAHYLTGDPKYEMWHKQVHEWSFNHFSDPEFGEWFGYLHRDGTVANTLKGSMWKGPFHLPRALLLCLKLLKKMQVEKPAQIITR